MGTTFFDVEAVVANGRRHVRVPTLGLHFENAGLMGRGKSHQYVFWTG